MENVESALVAAKIAAAVSVFGVLVQIGVAIFNNYQLKNSNKRKSMLMLLRKLEFSGFKK